MHHIRELAKKRGGKCLSNVYVNSRSKLLWECKYGHRWKATSASVACGTWCPKCAMAIMARKIKLTIQQMRQIAKSRAGKCLSKTYVNIQTGLLWECKEGHTWTAKPLNIKNGTWCPKCAAAKRGRKPKLTIEQMQEIARERGGKCLSETYTNICPSWSGNAKRDISGRLRPRTLRRVAGAPSARRQEMWRSGCFVCRRCAKSRETEAVDVFRECI